MEILQTLIMIVLALVAVVHALWGIGYWFPIRDERKLVRTVVGAMDATRMPGAIPCAPDDPRRCRCCFLCAWSITLGANVAAYDPARALCDT